MNDKQKQQSRERSKRYREKQKGVGVTESVTMGSKNVTRVTATEICNMALEKLTPQLIPDDQIPSAVVRPQVEWDGHLADAAGLLLLVNMCLNWQSSQAYAELFYRLTHWPLEKLKQAGHWIPVWREALG